MKPTDAIPHPKDWQTATVGQTVEIKRGISWSKEQEHSAPREGAVPVIRISNVQERLELDDLIYISGLKPKAVEKKRVSAGWSVMVGSNGNRMRIGNAILIGERADFLFASFLVGTRPREGSGIIPEFYYRWLSSDRVQAYITASSEGTTGLSNLSHSFFKAMAIPFPKESDEQVAIARVLDAIDTVLDRTRFAMDKLKEVKRALLQQFFCSALGETAYADRPKKKLPNGWAIVPTETLLTGEPKNGVSPKTSSQPPGTPTFSIAAVREGRVNLHDKEHIKFGQLQEKVAEQFRIKRGDVLIVRGNANPDLVGKAGMVDKFPEGCIYPDITKRVVFRTEGEHTVLPAYAVFAWNHPIVHNQILRRAKTSNGTLKINSRDVKQIIMPVPPPDEQAAIVKLSAAVDAKIYGLGKVLAAQKQLKKSLMQDLLTGKKRIKS